LDCHFRPCEASEAAAKGDARGKPGLWGEGGVCPWACAGVGIIEESIFEPFYTSRDPNVYAYTEFGENISIGWEDMPPKRNSKNAP